MEGKVCVITGAARGLGNVFCHALIESGCNQIAIIDLFAADAERAAKELVQHFEENAGIEPGTIETAGYGVDVSDEAAVKAAFDQIVQKWGKVDVVITAAGIVENFSALTYPTDRMKKLFDINVHGSYFCAREAARHMLERGTKGSIILIASMSAKIVNHPQFQTPYNASKAAVRHMAASLAVEWAKDGIRVNSLSPGYMLTQLTKTILEKSENAELKTIWESMTPMGKMGDPSELKGAIVYLASDASSFMTGADLCVDGGFTCI